MLYGLTFVLNYTKLKIGQTFFFGVKLEIKKPKSSYLAAKSQVTNPVSHFKSQASTW